MKKTLVFLLHILIIAVLCLAFLIWVDQSIPDYPKAKDGVLDLNHWDFESDGRITLEGQWEFNWGQFLSSKDYSSRSDLNSLYVPVPKSWNRYKTGDVGFPGFGYATYRLKVKVPNITVPLSLRISSMSTAYQCFLNDRLIAENGKISTSPKGSIPYYKPVTAVFTPPDKEFDIIIHVSNYTYARGGLWYDIDFGTQKQIQDLEAFLKYKDGFIIGILAFITLYYFCYLCIQRNDRNNLYFMLLCMILILRTSLYGSYLIVRLFPHIPFRLEVWLAYMTLVWFPFILYQNINNFASNEKYRLLGKFFGAYALVATIITSLLPVSVFTRWTTFYELIATFIIISALSDALLAHLKKIQGTNVILLGAFIVGVTALHDALYQANLIHSTGELLSIGLIVFMFLLFFLRAVRISKTYQEVQSLSDELALKLKLEQDLTERLYALDKLKDEFLANTSHELRTPLNGIINITQSVLHGIGGQINSVQRQNLEVVLSSAKKLHVLINDLLDVSLLRTGGIKIVSAPLNLHMLISNMLIVFHHLKNNESIELLNEIPSDFPLVSADESRLRQIINNLIGNALKFTDSGKIIICACHDGEWARIYVEDTGIGIAPDQLANIFNAFQQVDGTIQRKYEGAGLGLYITKQLVELHGGKIWITSIQGKGTQAFFTLPLSQRTPSEKQESPPPPVIETNTLNFLDSEFEKSDAPYYILAAEDDIPSLQALMNLLQLANFHAKGVNSGREALNLLESGSSFDLVILDVMMPELSGFEVLEAIRKKYNRLELPVLMLTAKTQAEDISLCFKLGANDYLAKPFEAEELLARVNSLVRLRQAVNKLVTSEMSFLQAQIKPHFIHNALSVISSLSIKDPQKAKALILDLSDYLRGSFDLNNEEGLTTLSKELELVRAYLSIEQARFKERLKINYHLLNDVDCTLPLLTIQPLVENAIRHGIMCKMEGGEILISTTLEPDRVRIEVKDTGVGMDPDRIAKFFEVERDQRGVGISNIHRRLMTHYGEGLHIESIPGQGTAVWFYIPYVSGKEISNENSDS